MTALTLKIIALVSMLLDHLLKANLFGQDVLMQWGLDMTTSYRMIEFIRPFGRLAFPIFAFMIAEGARRTHNIKKYLLRLVIFALISELPFDLALNTWASQNGMTYNISFLKSTNVLYTFVLAVSGIALYEVCRRKRRGRMLRIISLAVPALLAAALRTDYTLFGVALVYAAYLPDDNKRARFLAMAGVLTVLYLGYGSFWFTNLTGDDFISLFMSFVSLGLLCFYNGQRGGRSSSLTKWLFYIAYPAHLALYGLWRLLLP